MNPDRPDNSSPNLQKAMQLISALCDARITPEQALKLESLLLAEVEIQSLYLRMMHLDAGLYHYASALGSLNDANADLHQETTDQAMGSRMDETMMLPAMPEPSSVDSGELGEIFQPPSVLPEQSGLQSGGNRLPYLKGGIAAVLLLSAGLLGYLLVSNRGKAPVSGIPQVAKVEVAPPPIPVATLERTFREVWQSADLPPPDGNFVAGQLLSLKSGDVQLTLHRGGRLVVEGPAELEFVSENNISLHHGKIVATVPGGGLVVSCPHGSVKDLGTEFAMAVNPDGATEVAVFQGRVSAALTSTATSQPANPLLLTVGQAAVMTDKVLSLSPDGAVPQRFVCNLVNATVTSLDVTDLISGGDGTTHRRGIGINASTGDIGMLPPVEVLPSDRKYHRVKGYPVIDGACIADGTRGPMVVDSAGHQFQFSTPGSSAFNNIYTGGQIPWPVAATISTVLDGVDYSSPDHGIICIHPNNALTLDLDAIRRIYPDRALTNFYCRVGNSAPVKPKATRNAIATVDVLVDGVAAYENPHVSSMDGSFVINLPLLKQARFLTLASTDSRKEGLDDWILWTDARIDLSAEK